LLTYFSRPTPPGGQATRLDNALSDLLSRFAEEIASVRVLDPACGPGTFLGVSRKQLLNSEKGVITFARDAGSAGFFPVSDRGTSTNTAMTAALA
jgi:hypothetical protein